MSIVFNSGQLEMVLKSDSLSDAVAVNVIKLLRGAEPPEQLCVFMPEGAIGRLEKELCMRIQVAICEAGLPMIFAKIGGEIAIDAMTQSVFGKAIARKAASLVHKPMARELENYIITDAHHVILELIDHELRRISNSPVKELSDLITQDDEEFRDLVKMLCGKFMNNNAQMIAESVEAALRSDNRIVVREETDGDHAAIRELSRAAFANAEHADSAEQEGFIERLRGSQVHVPELSLVAERDGELVGHVTFAEITAGGSRAIALAALSVLPEFQIMGIGNALIGRAREIASEKGYCLHLPVAL